MTLKQLFTNILVEINKVEASSLLLEDFNYLVNKAVYNSCDKDYSFYEINQQLTDNLRVLKATVILPAVLATQKYESMGTTFGQIYEVTLPSDYYHILGCNCYFLSSRVIGCKPAGSEFNASAIRLTSDA